LRFVRTDEVYTGIMRLRITKPLSGSIDGIQLSRFTVGFTYEVGTSLGCYLLSERVAEPADEEVPALILPLDQQMFHPRVPERPRASPPKVDVAIPRAEAADRPRRKARRKIKK
jgi:hypothetical protein